MIGKPKTLREFMQAQQAAAERKQKRKFKKREFEAIAKASKTNRNGPRTNVLPKIGSVLPRKTLVARLDAIFSLFVRKRGKERTGGTCELCGKRPIEVCFHWVSRGDFATRWDPSNAVGSCKGCNFEETFRKRKYRDMHIDLIGLDAREALEAKARTITHFTDADLRERIEFFKAELGKSI